MRAEAFWSLYGMAETTLAVTSGGYQRPLCTDIVDGESFRRSGRAVPAAADAPGQLSFVSSGSALPETELRIISASGGSLGEREVGEIIVRMPSLACGVFSMKRTPSRRRTIPSPRPRPSTPNRPTSAPTNSSAAKPNSMS